MITRRAFTASLAASVALPGRAFARAPLKIGVVNPFTGPLALYGDEMTRGMDLAVANANAAGGVLGAPVQLVRGSAGTAQEGIAAVEQLVGRDGVDALTGTYVSAISNAASEAALNENKLFWETNALARDLTERGLPNFVRCGPNGDAFAERSVEGTLTVVAKALNKEPKAMKVWIEHEDSTFGTSIADAQERLLKAAGVTVLRGKHDARSVDLTDAILRAKAGAPDLWLSTAYVLDHNLLLRAAREQGFKPPVMMLVGTGDTVETRDALGDFVEGILLVSYPRTDSPPAAGYLAAYRAAYNRDPVAPQSMNAYTGMQMMLKAIAAAGTADYDKVIAAAAKMDEPFGTYCTGYGVKFSDKMQNTRALPIIAQWQDRKVVAVYPPAEAAAGAALRPLGRA